MPETLAGLAAREASRVPKFWALVSLSLTFQANFKAKYPI